MIHKAIIICGSSRSGKTTLVKLVNLYSKSHNGFIYEGLFPAYLSRLSYMFKRFHHNLLKEYMDRPRFIDEQKSKTITPIEQVHNEINYKGSFLSSLDSFFGENWVIADLHAELYYKQLLSAWHDIYFCTVIRDPRDCICAGLYWRDFPNSKANRKSWFYKCLFSWILSTHIAHKIKKEHPENITIVNFNQVKNDKIVPKLLDLKDGWDKNLSDNAYYSFVGNGQFTTPNDGEVLELLTSKERAIIQNLCADNMEEYNYKPEEGLLFVNIVGLRVIKYMIIGVANFSPSLARGFIDLLFVPRQHVKNQINRLKQFIKDIKNL